MDNFILFGFLSLVGLWFLMLLWSKYSNADKKLAGKWDHREFEFYCARFLRCRGYLFCKVMAWVADGWIDVVARRFGIIKYVIQCKRYPNAKVWPNVVKQICYDARKHAVIPYIWNAQPWLMIYGNYTSGVVKEAKAGWCKLWTFKPIKGKFKK